MLRLLQIRFRSVFFRGIAIASAVISASSSVNANFTGWDFEDGTLQGWTNVSTSTIGPTEYGPLGKTFPEGETWWDPHGYNSKDPAYGFAAAPIPFDIRAEPHDAPLVLRSPTFELHGGGQLIAHLLGGIPGELAVPPSNFSAVSGPSISTADDDASYQGLALRRVSDGEYLLHKTRTSNSSSYNGWQQLTFTEAELAGVMASNPGELFTIDLIDTAHGAFSSLNLDTITIPQPAGDSLIQGGGLWTIYERAGLADVGVLADADALMALPMGDPGIVAEIEYTDDTINLHDGFEMNGHFGNDDFFLAGQNDFAAKITGNINVLQSGEITFGFYANDGGRLMIDGQLVAQDDNGDLASDTLGTINLSAGVHTVEFLHFQNSGQYTVELYVATALGEYTSLNEATFELLQATDLLPPEGIPGDYNDDGKVDAADFVMWRDLLGGNVIENEGAGISPGAVDLDDYAFWASQFGSGAGSGSNLATGVPEPSALGLVSLVFAMAAIYRHFKS